MTFHGKEGESDFDKMRARSGIEIGQKGQSASPSIATAATRCSAGTSDQRIEEGEREKGTKRAGGSSVPSVAGGKVREGGRPWAHERRREGPRGPVACCGGRPCCIVIRAGMSREGRQQRAKERGIDREVLNDLHLR